MTLREHRRILLLDQYGTLGGGQRILCGMVERLASAGWTPSVASPDGPLRDAVVSRGASWSPLDLPELSAGRKRLGDVERSLSAADGLNRQLAAALAEARPNLVHVNGARALLVVARRTIGIPVTFHAHSTQDRASEFVTRLLVRKTKPRRVIVPSVFMHDWVASHVGVREDRIVVVENWVDPGFMPRDSSPSGERTGGSRVGVVGRVSRDKGQLDALKAVLDLRTQGLDVTLVVAGEIEPSYHQAMSELARVDADALQVLGFVPDVPAFLSSMDVVVVPSLHDESFGLAAAESMACGVPVVAYDSGALGAVLGDAGVVVDKGDIAALTSALAGLVADWEARARLSQLGRARAEERFDYARQTDKLLAVLAAAMDGES